MQFNLLKRSIAAIATARRRRELIQYRAFYDELTGLPNRYLFSDRLEQALAKAHRRPCCFAVAFIDIDGFKIVNDAFGHCVGDALLRHIGACLTTALRAGDIAARFGGDEFVLLLLDVSDVAVVDRAIDRLNDALHQPVRIDGHDLAPSCSVGVSFFPQDGADAPTLLKRADVAMYAQKNTGRANLRLSTPLRRSTPCLEVRGLHLNVPVAHSPPPRGVSVRYHTDEADWAAVPVTLDSPGRRERG